MQYQRRINHCLASCLLYIVGKQDEATYATEELDFYNESVSIGDEFTFDHLTVATKQFGTSAIVHIGSRPYYEYLKKHLKVNSTRIKHTTVTKQFLKQIAKQGRFVAFIDFYYCVPAFDLRNKVHDPHYVIVTQVGKTVTFLDPHDGKEKILSLTKFIEAIRSLRNRLGFSPKFIQLTTTNPPRT